MTLTTRIVPRDEWTTVLAGTELGSVASIMPEETHVIAVEDETGRLMGCWSLTRMWHAEGIYIAPEVRQQVSVGRRLLVAMKYLASKMGTHVILSAAKRDDDQVRHMLLRVGATPVDVQLFEWPLGVKE
jgi:hypothetical protein